MALQLIRIGSATDIFQYDDGAFASGIDCTAPISAAAPVNANEVLRLGDIGPAGPIVEGPGASTDHAVVRWDGVGGFTLQDSSLIVSDAGWLGIGTIPAYHFHSVEANTTAATAYIFRTAHSFSGNHPGGGDIYQYGQYFVTNSTVVGTQVAGNRQILYGLYLGTNIEASGQAYSTTGMYSITSHNHITALGALAAARLIARNTSTAVVGISYGLHSTVLNSGAGTITNAYGAYIQVEQTAGVITTGYLLRGVLAGTIGTAWGIHLAGSTLNYLQGRLGVNREFATAQLHVDQSDNGGAIPVLSLDQADISDGFINFIGNDRGIILGATDSSESVRVEINGNIRRLALYADA